MRRARFVMMAVGALVAAAALLVYVERDAAAPRTGQDAAKAKDAPKPAADAPEILYDLNALPQPMQRMLKQIVDAAASGDIEAMRPVFESNELKPMVTNSYVDDPVAFWKKASVDGEGRDVMAAMLNVLSVGFVRTGKGADEMYVWPYFAAADLSKLTPAQEVELYRLVPPSEAATMKKSGRYAWYRLGVSPNGVWHYFTK